MNVEQLKIVEVIGNTVVQLAYVILFSYIAKLGSAYLHYRLTMTGKPIFEPNTTQAASEVNS